MKKILMRAGMSPLDNLSPFEVLTKNTIGNNIGNMLFPYSISRTLTKEDTEISTIVVEKSGSKKQIDYFNQEYDCLVLPFANAFRKSFIPNLKATANFVDKMKIPCSVVGIGMQKELGKDTKNPDLDDATKKFMKAVLKKSAIVGVRGEETGQYLKDLGFIEEKEFTVIGCPSMYTFGKELPKTQLTELTTESSLSFNSKISLPQKFHDFIHRSMMEYKNYNYVPSIGATQQIRQTLTAFRGKVDSEHNNNGEFNTSVKAMYRLSSQKTNKESQDFSDTIDQIN